MTRAGWAITVAAFLMGCGGAKSRGTDDTPDPGLDGEGGAGGLAKGGTTGTPGGTSGGAGNGATAGNNGGAGQGGNADSGTGAKAGTSGKADAAAGDARPESDGAPPSRDSGTGDAGGAAGTPGASVNVLTNRYDNLRTGNNPNEKVLTVANVGMPDGFGLIFSREYDGNPYGQPLYASGLTINGMRRNVVFIATTTNNVYAFDADLPTATMPLWTRRVAAPAPIAVDPNNHTNGYVRCKDMYPFIGITSTPVIDLQSGRMYVVAKEGTLGGGYFNKLHVLDILTGVPVAGSPVVIDASVPGTGKGAVGGVVKLDGWRHLVRPGLLLHNGVVYLGVGSHCDDDPYHGWVLGYDATTLQRQAVYNVTPNGTRGAIWQSGVGLAANANGIYFATGNGDSTPDGKALSLSVVRLKADGSLLDWFTPSNVATLNSSDKDVAGGVLLLPNATQMVATGKEGVIYLIDQLNLGHFDATTDKIAQRLPVTGLGEIHSMTYWNKRLYVWPDDQGLSVFSYANNKLGITPVGTFVGRKPAHPGGTMVISSNGETPGTAIIWASTVLVGDAWHDIAKGQVFALDAADPSKTLWDSNDNAARDAVGNLAKFTPPTVANGKLYIATFAASMATSPSYLRVYGLLK